MHQVGRTGPRSTFLQRLHLFMLRSARSIILLVNKSLSRSGFIQDVRSELKQMIFFLLAFHFSSRQSSLNCAHQQANRVQDWLGQKRPRNTDASMNLYSSIPKQNLRILLEPVKLPLPLQEHCAYSASGLILCTSGEANNHAWRHKDQLCAAPSWPCLCAPRIKLRQQVSSALLMLIALKLTI